MTKIIKINPRNIDQNKINVAADIIKKWWLVALPTETVYGLWANWLDKQATKNIFIAKGRPSDNPLILHISDKKELNRLVKTIPENAKKLMEIFRPWPLTIIFQKSDIIPNTVTGWLDTIAVRMPNHPIALALIKASWCPIAAPSANLSTKPSPTKAEHVIQDFMDKIDIIINWWTCKVWVESTIIDISWEPMLLRPGGITIKQIEEIIWKIKIHPVVSGTTKWNINAKAPWMKYRHYAPKAEVFLIEGKVENIQSEINNLIKINNWKKIAVISTHKKHTYENVINKYLWSNKNDISKKIFNTFRELDKENSDIIFIEWISEKWLWLAIMNRIRKASKKIIYV